MQFTILAAITSFAIGTHAAAIRLPRQGTSNPRLAQFRVFSAAGCYDLNEGFYTVDTDQSNQCHSFATESGSTPNGYVSIELQAATAAAANCERELPCLSSIASTSGCRMGKKELITNMYDHITVLLYSDTACTETETVSALDACEDASVVQDGASYPTWNSYYYKCASSNATATA